jgi:hypothetical protein
MEPRDSVACSHQSAAGPYPEPHDYSPHRAEPIPLRSTPLLLAPQCPRLPTGTYSTVFLLRSWDFVCTRILTGEPWQRSRYSSWPWVERSRGRNSSPGMVLHIVQTGSEVHPASYPFCTGSKAGEARSYPLRSN